MLAVRVVVLASVATVGGCLGGPARSAPTSGTRTGATSGAATAPPGFDCAAADTAQIINVGYQGGTDRVGLIGAGDATVVLSNQSNESLCAWLPYARTLAGAGLRAAVWNYGGGALVADQLSAVVADLRSRFPGPVVLLGASQGAKVSIVAAGEIKPPVAGVVSLSAEDTLRPSIDVVEEARKVVSPILLVTAKQDPFGAAEAGPAILASVRSADKRLLTVDGSDHGTALLSGAAAARVLPAVSAFLQRVTAG